MLVRHSPPHSPRGQTSHGPNDYLLSRSRRIHINHEQTSSKNMEPDAGIDREGIKGLPEYGDGLIGIYVQVN